MHRILMAAAIAAAAAPGVVLSAADQAKAQGCGTYIIAGCFRDWNSAEGQRQRISAPLVVNTNDYPNFSNGWFCVADGPYQSGWQEELNYYRTRNDGNAVPDAYAKAAC